MQPSKQPPAGDWTEPAAHERATPRRRAQASALKARCHAEHMGSADDACTNHLPIKGGRMHAPTSAGRVTAYQTFGAVYNRIKEIIVALRICKMRGVL